MIVLASRKKKTSISGPAAVKAALIQKRRANHQQYKKAFNYDNYQDERESRTDDFLGNRRQRKNFKYTKKGGMSWTIPLNKGRSVVNKSRMVNPYFFNTIEKTMRYAEPTKQSTKTHMHYTPRYKKKQGVAWYTLDTNGTTGLKYMKPTMLGKKARKLPEDVARA